MPPYTALDAAADMAVIYAIVIVVSMGVAVIIRAIVWTLSRHAAAAAPPTPVPAAPPASADVPPEHLAAIGAALAAVLGAHRIVRIDIPGHSRDWTAEARSVHHASHRPHKP
jgi:hypothetical protein